MSPVSHPPSPALPLSRHKIIVSLGGLCAALAWNVLCPLLRCWPCGVGTLGGTHRHTLQSSRAVELGRPLARPTPRALRVFRLQTCTGQGGGSHPLGESSHVSRDAVTPGHLQVSGCGVHWVFVVVWGPRLAVGLRDRTRAGHQQSKCSPVAPASMGVPCGQLLLMDGQRLSKS